MFILKKICLSVIGLTVVSAIAISSEAPLLPFANSHVLSELLNPERDRRSDPDEGGYSFRDNDELIVPEFDWIDISENGERLDASNDWNSGILDFGFEFEWYCENYNSVNVCSNGWVTLDPDNNRADVNLPIPPDERDPNALFMINNYDLDPSAGGEMYFWTNEEDQAVVSWIEIPRNNNGDYLSTFQIIFNGDGSVIYQYGPMEGHNGQESDVGYESPDGQMGAAIAINENGYVQEGLVIRISNRWAQFDNEPGIMVFPEALEFGELLIDEEIGIEYGIVSVGDEPLTVTSLNIEGEGFSIVELEEDLIIESGDFEILEVVFFAGAEEEYEGNLIIESNAVNADDGITIVPLSGEGITQANIEIDPQGLEIDLNTGETIVEEVNIVNDGGLDWSFYTELEFIGANRGIGQEVEGPNRDDLGEELGRFAWERAPANFYKAGISHDTDNNWLWLASYSAGFIAAVDIDNDYEIITEVNSEDAMDNA